MNRSVSIDLITSCELLDIPDIEYWLKLQEEIGTHSKTRNKTIDPYVDVIIDFVFNLSNVHT